MRILRARTVLSVALVSLAPSVASAQPAPSLFSGVSVDVFGGLSTFGRLLEQYVGASQREVTAADGNAFGAALGVQAWETTALRLGVTRAPTEIDLRDDTGLGGANPLISVDGVADLTATVVALEATSGVLGQFSVFRPYTVVGVAAGWWKLGEQRAVDVIDAGAESSKFGFGGTGGLGVEIRPSSVFLIRLEATQFRLGNPFDGEDAWRVRGGLTFDEPESVRISRYTAGVGISLGS